MRAIVQERYGPPDVLRLGEIGLPAFGPRDVLVRVRAAPVAGDDWHLLRGLPYAARLGTGLRRPKHPVPGLELAGVVEAAGAEVRRFRPGDEVFGWCKGAFAEYAATPEDTLAPKPARLSFAEAAALPIAGLTALQALRDRGEVRPGQQVLVNGASGCVGTLAVQIARALGAEVTGVCSATGGDLVRALGADHVLDYARDDFAGNGRRYDVILDLAQSRSLAECRRALRPGGTLVLAGASSRRALDGRHRWFMGTDRWLGALALSPFLRERLRPLIHEDRPEDLLALAALAEGGQVRPVIDRTFPLEEVPEAIRYTERRRARGTVVIAI